MTRIALLSDIHGNLPALQAVMADFADAAIDQVVVAGDMIGGPFSAEVLETILAGRWAAIRGNHELYILDHLTPRMDPTHAHYAMPAALREALGPALINALATLPDTISLRFPDASSLRVVHASRRSHWEKVAPEDPDDWYDEIMAGTSEATIAHGHNHLQYERQASRWHIINPGSVGLPLDGDPRAEYAILTGDESGWVADMRRVPYPQDQVLAAMDEQAYPARYGAIGLLLREEFATAQTRIAPFNRWLAQEHPDAPETLEMAQRFLDTVSDFRPYTHERYARFLPEGA
jgi:predicted phosphodiesterase